MEKSIIAKFKENPNKCMIVFLNENDTDVDDLEWFNPENILTFEGTPVDYRWVYSFGGEGEGDRRQQVIELSESGESILIGLDGYYDSYNGTEWDTEWYVAEPYTFTETRYKKVLQCA